MSSAMAMAQVLRTALSVKRENRTPRISTTTC